MQSFLLFYNQFVFSYKYFTMPINRFFDTYTSINEANIRTISIIKETIVCLKISNFIFSLLLSFIIELCNFIPLTAKTIMHGINNIFCRRTVEIKNRIPFPNSIT